MNNKARAFIRAVRAAMRLEKELAKKYPFGSNDPNEIAEFAALYKRQHTYKMYLKCFDMGYDLDTCNAFDMPKRSLVEYTAAYGVFGDSMMNIVCEHGCANVMAHNPDEAMDIFFENEKHDRYYDPWLLTRLDEVVRISNPWYGDRTNYNYVNDRHHDVVVLEIK